MWLFVRSVLELKFKRTLETSKTNFSNFINTNILKGHEGTGRMADYADRPRPKPVFEWVKEEVEDDGQEA